MSYRLKDLYSEAFFDQLGEVLKEVLSSYDHAQFRQLIFVNHWEDLELKERMAHTTKVVANFLPAHFPEASSLIVTLSNIINSSLLYLVKRGIYFFFKKK